MRTSLLDIGPTPTGRWSAKAKASLAQAIIDGRITQEQAAKLYDLPPNEIGRWTNDYYLGGRGALTWRGIDERRKQRAA